ncbi:hypothetical protein C0Q70_01097 [Pomacea canaliculata]|uniref:Ig-like domain-containing protein n=1 Tax=Pomacea canaliculata TaxID=400727 RepID=A0A2T7PYH4_POMCA|nr:hypothetical protein C0Q70_01097 [Pomacea canaliculata]
MPAGGVVAYSWRQPGGSVIAGAVSATYTLSDVNFAKAGGYQCQVSYNALPSDYSAVLTVTGELVVVAHLQLSSVDFIVLVTSPGETVIKNQTSNTLTFLPLKLSDGGRYKCRVSKAGVDSAYS